MSSVETIRIDLAADARRWSESRSVQGVCANSSIPAPTARSAWPCPWTCAVTGSPRSCAAVTIDAS
jgi:predicted aconitase